MERRNEPVSAAAPARHEQGKRGSACGVCAMAKAKCIRSDKAPGSACDRCTRLAKTCTVQVHQPRKKRTVKSDQTSRLEERLNGLVDLLRASGELPGGLDRPRQILRQADSVSNSHSQGQSASTPGAGGDEAVIHVPPLWNASCPLRCVCGSPRGAVAIQTVPDAAALASYQTQLMPVFPFVVIPAGTKAEQSKAQRPFLFAAIRMASCTTDIQSRRALMYQLIQNITQEILISSARSLDILQALLVILAWFHNHCVMHAQMTSLLHLAQAQVADLFLNKEPEIHERTAVMVLAPSRPPARKSDEKRALLGVWFLSSVNYTSLMRTYPQRFTRYSHKCLRDIETSCEWESDQLLVHLVKIQRLTEKIHSWAFKEEEVDDDPPSSPQASLWAMAAYKGAFELEIQRHREALPPNLRNSNILQTLLATAALHLYQPPLIDTSLLKVLDEPPTATVDTFYQAKTALEDYFDSFFAFPVDFHLVMPVFILSNAILGVTILARWAKVTGPGQSSTTAAPDILTPQREIWDPSAVRPGPCIMFGSGIAPAPSFDSGSDEAPGFVGYTHERPSRPQRQATPRAGNVCIPPSITDASQIPAGHVYDFSHPDISRTVMRLKARLHGQPNVDVIGILSRMAQRCDETHAKLLDASPDREWHNDVWYFYAKKILIARAKLEKWAEIMANAAAAAASGGPDTAKQQPSTADHQPDIRTQTTSMPTAAPPSPSFRASEKTPQPAPQQHASGALNYFDAFASYQRQFENTWVDALPADLVYEHDMFGSVGWNDSIFDPLDPSLWLYAGGDWSGDSLGRVPSVGPG